MSETNRKLTAAMIEAALKEYKSKIGRLKKRSFETYKRIISRIESRKLEEIRKQQ